VKNGNLLWHEELGYTVNAELNSTLKNPTNFVTFVIKNNVKKSPIKNFNLV
tara:strand:+ start:4790 stop:4942 length:153 start_codon:yes stop_codon:yes gene_type:complete